MSTGGKQPRTAAAVSFRAATPAGAAVLARSRVYREQDRGRRRLRMSVPRDRGGGRSAPARLTGKVMVKLFADFYQFQFSAKIPVAKIKCGGGGNNGGNRGGKYNAVHSESQLH